MAVKGIDYVLSLNPTKYQSALSAVTTKTAAAAEAIDRYWKNSETGASKAGEAFVSMRTKVSSVVAALGSIYAIGVTAHYANEVRKIADEYTNLNSRLKLTTNGEQELATVREKLFRISQDTGTDYAGNADSYAKLARAVKDLGGTSSDTLQIVELVNKSLTINGSSTSMASAFMQQFAQAMGSGVLQGDEFRSMLENNGYFANQLATALNTNIAGLRSMASNGQLTADKLRSSFPRMAQTINTEFDNIAPTVERAMTMLENSFKRIVDESNRSAGGTKAVSQSVIDLAATIDRNRDGIVSLFTRLIDGAAWATKQVAGIGTEMEVLGQVAKGNLGFFDYIKMTSVEEMHDWLVKNVQTLKETGPAAQKAGAEVSAAAQKSAATQKQATGDALKDMKKRYQDYAKEIRQLQESIASQEQSLAAELRSMARSGMSDSSAWNDQKQEAQEYELAAKKAAKEAAAAMKTGDTITASAKWKDAVSMANEAKQAYKNLNTEVKDGDNVIISKQQALQTAMAGAKAAGELAISITKQQQEATVGVMNTLTQQSGFANLAAGMTTAEQQWLTSWENMKNAAGEKITLVKQQIDSISTNADQVKDKVKTAFSDIFQPPEDGNWGKVWEAMESGSKKAGETVTGDWDKVWDKWLASGSDDIRSLEEQLRELTRDRTAKIYVEKVEKNQSGGLIGAYKFGGLIQALAAGGGVRNILSGGHLPGFGGGDRRLLLGEDGEVMLNKYAVRAAGLKAALAFNAGRFDVVLDELRQRVGNTIGYRLGGLVDRLPKMQSLANGGAVAAGSDFGTINLSFPSGASVPVQTTRELARTMLREFDRMGWRASA